MDSSPPGSSVHGVSQGRILEWVTISSSGGIFLTEGSNPCLLRWFELSSIGPWKFQPALLGIKRGRTRARKASHGAGYQWQSSRAGLGRQMSTVLGELVRQAAQEPHAHSGDTVCRHF